MKLLNIHLYLVCLIQLSGCSTLPDRTITAEPSSRLSPSSIVDPETIPITRTLGVHPWPCKVNERFIIEEVRASANRGVMPPNDVLPVAIAYYLDGERQTLTFKKEGDTDGYITYVGYFFGESEKMGERQGGLSEEHIIRLKTGEEITIVGNTLPSRGMVRLRKL